MYYCYNYLIYTCNLEFVCLVNSVNIKKQHSDISKSDIWILPHDLVRPLSKVSVTLSHPLSKRT